MSEHSDAGFQILEHTADVGVRSWGPSVEEAFAQATLGLLGIVGVWQPDASGETRREEITLEGRDLGALLVDWLGEVLYLQDAHDVVISGFEVTQVDDRRAAGWVEVAPRPQEIEGTAVKAVTYHQLSVERVDSRWVATVYLDI